MKRNIHQTSSEGGGNATYVNWDSSRKTKTIARGKKETAAAAQTADAAQDSAQAACWLWHVGVLKKMKIASHLMHDTCRCDRSCWEDRDEWLAWASPSATSAFVRPCRMPHDCTQGTVPACRNLSDHTKATKLSAIKHVLICAWRALVLANNTDCPKHHRRDVQYRAGIKLHTSSDRITHKATIQTPQLDPAGNILLKVVGIPLIENKSTLQFWSPFNWKSKKKYLSKWRRFSQKFRTSPKFHTSQNV